MELYADKPRVIRQGNDLYQTFVRRKSGDLQALFSQLLAEVIVEFKPVAVTLIDQVFAVDLVYQTARCQLARIQSQLVMSFWSSMM